MSAVQYLGHGANTGGLQAHSIGDEYPYLIQGVARNVYQRTQWQVLDTRTGNVGRVRNTYAEAAADITALRIRNMLHS